MEASRRFPFDVSRAGKVQGVQLRFAFLTMIAMVVHAGAQAQPAAPDRIVATTLAGESCRIVARENTGLVASQPADLDILCDGNTIRSLPMSRMIEWRLSFTVRVFFVPPYPTGSRPRKSKEPTMFFTRSAWSVRISSIACPLSSSRSPVPSKSRGLLSSKESDVRTGALPREGIELAPSRPRPL